MSVPTILAPWFIVYRVNNKGTTLDAPQYEVQWYMSPQTEAAEKVWTTDQQKAMLITSLQSAARIAKTVAGEVRVLTSRDELLEFRPEGVV